MKIRYKIAFLITLAGILVSLVFSVFVFIRMSKLTYAYIDQDLKTISLVFSRLATTAFGEGNLPFKPETQFPEFNRYFVTIYDRQLNPVYANDMTRGVKFAYSDPGKSRYTTALPVPQSRRDLDPDKDGEVTIRVRIGTLNIHGVPYYLQVAKPIEKMDRQFAELVWIVVTGFIITSVLIALISYFLAGLIIKPVSQINQFASGVIDEKTIARRLPLSNVRDELHALSDTLNRMFDRLQFSFNRQKQLVADASHELKSPIAVSLLFLEKALQRQDLPEDLKNEMAQHYNGVLRMRRMVNSLLDLAAMEMTERINESGFCLVTVMADILENYKGMVTEKGITIVFEHPTELFIEADKDKINRLLINLVDNAIKYCADADGKISIRLFEEKRSEVVLQIENNGIGIAPHDLPHVFEQFYRAEKSRSKQLGGVGLGLALAKRIVELHKGRISIASQVGRSTQVSLFFPKYQTTAKPL